MFINLLQKVWVGSINAEKLLKARFKHKSDKNYPKNALLMYAENEPAIKNNEALLSDLSG